MANPLHPDSRLDPCLTSSNDSGNSSIFDIIDQRLLDRRQFFKLSVGALAGLSTLSPWL